jgi:hypothetical protein
MQLQEDRLALLDPENQRVSMQLGTVALCTPSITVHQLLFSNHSSLRPLWVRIFKGDGTLFHDGFLAFPEAMKYRVKVGVGRALEE